MNVPSTILRNLAGISDEQIDSGEAARREPRLGNGFKRFFDIVVAAVVLVLLAPIFGLIGLAIRRDSPGPVYYRGPRVGLGGKVFFILKFRTMYEDPESYSGPRVTTQEDPRVTRLGRWLRDTKLNELPQFWNVLIGEMSLVGPRPEDPNLVQNWTPEERQEILSVRPGITSPASVQYRDEESLLSPGNLMQQYIQELGPDKMRLDQLYVRYHSFTLDLDVLFWTALVLLPRVGAHTPPEQLLFVGPVTRLIRRHVSWFIIDLLVTGMAIGFTGLVWRAFGPLDVGWPRAAAMGMGFALLFSVCGAIFGVNRVKWTKAADTDAFDLLPGWVLAATAAYIVNSFLGLFPGELVLAAAFLALLSFILVRYRSRLIHGVLNRFTHYRSGVRPAAERVLIVGSGPIAQLAAWLLAHPTHAGNFRLVGFVDDDLLKQETRIYGAHVLGTCKDISRLVKQYDVGVVILADERILASDGRPILESCQAASARMVIVPDVLANLGSVLGAGSIQGRSLCNQPDGDGFLCQHCLAHLASSED